MMPGGGTVRMALVWLTACGPGGSDLCDRMGTARGRCGTAPTPDELAACEDSIKDCSSADVHLLNGYVDCLDGVDCTAEEAGFYDCAAMLVDLEDPGCGF